MSHYLSDLIRRIEDMREYESISIGIGAPATIVRKAAAWIGIEIEMWRNASGGYMVTRQPDPPRQPVSSDDAL